MPNKVERCRSCGQAVKWVKTAKGKLMPTDADGTSHFATCPQADSWRKPKDPTDA